MGNQHEVNLGFTKTVLLCLAFEYSEIWVSWILLDFLAIYGFTIKFIWWLLTSWFRWDDVWFNWFFQFDELYWAVFMMLFSTPGTLC